MGVESAMQARWEARQRTHALVAEQVGPPTRKTPGWSHLPRERFVWPDQVDAALAPLNTDQLLDLGAAGLTCAWEPHGHLEAPEGVRAGSLGEVLAGAIDVSQDVRTLLLEPLTVANPAEYPAWTAGAASATGWWAQVPEGQHVTTPWVVSRGGAGCGARADTLVVMVGAGASLTWVDAVQWLGDARGFSNVRVHVAAGGCLDHVRLTSCDPGATSHTHTTVTLEAGASCRLFDAMLGGVQRHGVTMIGEGDGASLTYHGVLLPSVSGAASAWLDTTLNAPNAKNVHSVRGLVPRKAKALARSCVTVPKDVAGCVSEQQLHHVMLEDAGLAVADPQLVIRHDAVEASHGATVGQLDEAGLFYLRSRGLPEALARRVLMRAFIQAWEATLPSEALREGITSIVDHAMQGWL